jgi:hypothetical protein
MHIAAGSSVIFSLSDFRTPAFHESTDMELQYPSQFHHVSLLV